MRNKTDLENIVIVNGQILQGEKFIEGRNLLIRDGKIVKIDSSMPRGFKTVNAAGCRVIPGFIDLHLHCDPPRLGQEAQRHLKEISLNHARYGTTRFLATFCTSSLEKFKSYASFLKSSIPLLKGAQPLGCHLEGPFLSSKRAGAQPSADMQVPSLEVLKVLLAVFGKSLRMMTLAPELKGIESIIKELKAKRIRVAMGHTDATYQETQAAIGAGVRYGTHLFNQMRGLHHRELGAVGGILFDDRAFAELIVDGVHVHPLMVKLAIQVKSLKKIVLATDCFVPLKGDGKQDLPRLPDGTLLGSTLSLRRAVINLVKFARVSWIQAMRAATLNPACALGIERDYGTLEPGKYADVVLVDKKFNVKMTIVGGKVVHRS
jgi:N-acetylglucosamine-6-phosphate deacetylase